MIRLKNLLVEENSLAKTDGNVSSKPNVLFIGDSTIKRPWSYAQRLLSYNTVEGNVVTAKNPTTADLLRLVRTNINDKYNVISISFFNLDKNEMKEQSVSRLIRTYSDILEVAKSYGAKIIVVTPTETSLPTSLYDWLTSQNIADSVLQNGQEDDIRRLNSKVYYKWVDTVNDLLKTKLVPVDNKKTAAIETDPDKPLGDVLKISNEPKSLNGKKPVSVNTNKGTSNKSIIQPTNIINANFSDSAENQAYDIILPFEGFNATPQIDLFTDKHGVVHGDGYCRIGHGSSHITKADGKVINLGKPAAGKSCEETYPYTIEPEDAHRDLRRLISKTFKPYVIDKIRSWGGDVSKFNDASIAVLISVVYNYGHMPEKLKSGIASSDMIAIATSLKTEFTSSKSNPKRRKKEGDYILSSLSSNPSGVAKSANGESPSLFKQAWNSVKGVLGFANTEPIVPKPYTGKLGYTSGFGPRWGKFHYGVDFSLGVGTPIYIVIPGEIIRADGRNATGYGNVIYVKHEDGVVTRYGHMSRMDVSVGQRVEKGDLIGLTGGKKGAPGAGNSTGPHLHWEYHVNGKAVNGINEAEKYFSTKPVKIEQQPIELPSLNV